MQRIRRATILLILAIGLFAALTNLVVASDTNLQVRGYAFAIALAAAIFSMVWPSRSRLYSAISIIVWIIVYTIVWHILFPRIAFLSGEAAYLTVVEIIMIVLVLVVTQNLSVDLKDVESSLYDLLLSEDSIPVAEELSGDIEKEFYRSRRHKHALSLIVIKPEEELNAAQLGRILQDMQHNLQDRQILSRLARHANKHLRKTDLVMAQTRDNQLIVLTPYTDIDGAGLLAERIQQELDESVGIQSAVGVSAFPDDGIALEDLVEQARDRM
ncbi:MAG: hypothetical protein DWQ07_02170 [Chloroflexi bacterium]|nr:MAG: hypothetical protein DWQ07_02170 [Chloroflexota bacterium]MBL1193696.1 hypothetical protein [Chloroflexota bacterium]NOH10989.1 hypothetical protein [Chloroflexota bacterium]